VIKLFRFVTLGLAATLLAGLAAAGWMVRPGAEVFRVVRTDNADYRWTPDKPLWVLLLGDDQRGNIGCGCSDAIHLVGVPPGGGSAVMLNIPRDTRVSIPGNGIGRINSALSLGGPKLAADTIGRLVGVPISYVMVTTFGGLRGMIDELGGVDVVVPYVLKDKAVGIDVGPGRVHLDGAQALSYARSRHPFPDGDITRTANQANLILSMLGKLRSQGASAADTLRYLAVFIRHSRTEGASTTDLLRLGRLAISIDPANIRTVVPPERGVMISGQSMLDLMPAAQGLFADLADDARLQSH
jgi:polyisoprenyl-teichoic acid--peptidoglycan teichoic acid transferase